jgi:hypothetical protein
MLLDNYKKESPIIGVAGMGGGINSYIFLSSDGGYVISRSLRFSSGDSAYLNRTPSSAGNRTTWTWSGWVKRSSLVGSERQVLFGGYGASSDTEWLEFGFGQNNETNDSVYLTTSAISQGSTAVFRDLSAWYHYVANYDGSNFKIYINNSLVLTKALTGNRGINGNWLHTIGKSPANTIRYFNGYLAEVNFIDGQALAPTDFGETDDNGVWQPKLFAGTYGTNGFHLDFSDNSSNAALGTDTSSNGNTWTVNNLSVATGAGNDSLRDSPTNGTASSGGDPGGSIVGNYATLNPLVISSVHGLPTLSNGNLDAVAASSGKFTTATIGVSSGKYYWEVTAGVNASGGTSRPASGFNNPSNHASTAFSWRQNGGTIGLTGSPTFATYTTGDTIGIALNVDNTEVTFYKNGTLEGSGAYGYTNTDNIVFPGLYSAQSDALYIYNFGQRAFHTAAPAGYKALCTANLPEPTIADGSQYFDTKLWSGNGGTQAISGLNFSPDFAWIKQRNSNRHNTLYDSVRGVTKFLISNNTAIENTDANSITSFDSNGFSVGSMVEVNASGGTYVGWAWDGGSSTVTNTDGSISSQVRANPSAGFSIVSWTATTGTQTVGHQLNDTPKLVIMKNRSTSSNWAAFNTITGSHKLLYLNLTNSQITPSEAGPTSSVFTVSQISSTTGTSGNNMIAYCLAPVEGYSAMGSYVGNG